MSTETVSDWLARVRKIQDFDISESDSNDKTGCNECLEPIMSDEPRYAVSITEGSGTKREYMICHDCVHYIETELTEAES